MSRPDGVGESLRRVARELEQAGGPLGLVALEPAEAPVFGPLAAAGPGAGESPEEYAFAIEAIREGYLLHYGEPRIAQTDDQDLALLTGDFLYALGLSHLAGLGDTEAVAELAALISDCAAIHAKGGSDETELAERRWRAAAERIAASRRKSPRR